ncbi:MAG: ATP-dependent DNA helicase RecG, partial [Oscillospiraceae bacterium]|nr:ATP-dependent DNA helicase RecG [Oscillospiraceae bacterium]
SARKSTELQSAPLMNKSDLGEFYDALDFELTKAQKRVIEDCIADMLSGKPMSRLVQGDVGSGKTVVAAACAWYAWKSGYQSAFMVPTEILATQHYSSLSELLEPLGMRVDILTGGMGAKKRREALGRLSTGETDLVIGTHALISEGVEYCGLGLVISDEQHRFGVQQRAALSQKGNSPHVLVMSATPIPRTLALIIYGDLDISVIDELPPGRQTVDTYVVTEDMRQRINNFIRRLVAEGRQVYIVCPMVEDSENGEPDLKPVKEYAKALQEQVFPELRVSLIHGKMKPSEKDRVMDAFVRGESDILVATTVIEVGVNVPNAALMVVENADRFGLSQLHQLRGRVGRGKHKSYCVLFEGKSSELSHKRLKTLCETNDGFKIAQEDLKLRGPGDFFGKRQHGLPVFHIVDLNSDMKVMEAARQAAALVMDEDPAFKNEENRLLGRQVSEMMRKCGDALN